MNDPGAVSAAYDAWSASYDVDVNPTRDLSARVLRTSGIEITGRDVIELGCGTGQNTGWLAASARHVTAVDFSVGMLDRARASIRAAHVHFVRHDVTAPLPFSTGAFDVVVATLVLEHVEQLSPVFAEAARVLRPGGTAFFSELHPERQRLGGQAHFFRDPASDPEFVPAFRHSVGEFVNGGIGAGLVLVHLGEWIEAGAPPDVPPRLLSVRFASPD